jgi:hypothetical protein
VTGDVLAYQALFFGEGPYNLISANVDYRVVTSGEAQWDIEFCTSGDFVTTPSWSSVFTTPITIDSGEQTSQSAATPPVFDAITLPEGARVRAVNDLPSGEDGTITLMFQGTT